VTIQYEISAIFDNYDKYNFDPVDCLVKCEALLQEVCLPGAICDPRDVGKVEQACNAYGFASGQFLYYHLPSAATSILQRAWNAFSDIQAADGQRIYRAGLAMYLAKSYLTLRDRGASLRWALLTQADDLLGQHAAGGGAGKQLLVSVLGLSSAALETLSGIATENLARIGTDGWSVTSAYPEDVITKFAFRNPEYAQLFATASSEFEYPLNPAYFHSLIAAASTEGLSTTEKGRKLEDLATYLFLLIPGLVPRRNILDETLASETDIVIRNLTPNSTVISDLLGRHFLVECKNWARPVSVQQVGYFLYRIRLTHASFGIMFAAHGITGNQAEETAAHSLIRKAFHEDGTVCIVIDIDALNRLGEGYLSLWSMILERIERVRFGKAI
jgi:hypothetical protein